MKDTNVIYCPFPGTITGHPSVLSGSFEDIAADAKRITGLEGIGGVDLLAYRHLSDPNPLMEQVVEASAGPVIIAGSINSADRIDAVAQSGAWAFTIGSAVLNRSFLGEHHNLAGPDPTHADTRRSCPLTT